MTYYVINNPITNQTEYFVPDEATKLSNDHISCIVGTQEDANAKNEQNKQDFLEQESYRFTIAKEIVDGDNTTWINADLLNDTQEGIYNVFNQFTGLHERIDGLSNAINRVIELKTQFINQLSWDVNQIQELPKYSQAGIGPVIGDIPVEVM